MLSASAEQIGIAARMRDSVSGNDRKMLNYVVHSPHPNPRYGPNPFGGRPYYDPQVTTLLRDVAKRNKMPISDVEMVEIMHEIKDLMRSVCKAKEIAKVISEIQRMRSSIK